MRARVCTRQLGNEGGLVVLLVVRSCRRMRFLFTSVARSKEETLVVIERRVLQRLQRKRFPLSSVRGWRPHAIELLYNCPVLCSRVLSGKISTLAKKHDSKHRQGKRNSEAKVS
jgi:hypothetical protein